MADQHGCNDPKPGSRKHPARTPEATIRLKSGRYKGVRLCQIPNWYLKCLADWGADEHGTTVADGARSILSRMR